jgi:hypothetical protein
MNAVWKEGRAAVGGAVTSLRTIPPLAYSTVLTTLGYSQTKGPPAAHERTRHHLLGLRKKKPAVPHWPFRTAFCGRANCWS